MSQEPSSNYQAKACILTSVHSPYDTRIFHKEARTLAQAGYEVVILAPHEAPEEVVNGIRVVGLPKYRRRIGRLLNWPRFLRIGLRERADIYHFHDPDLLFVGLVLRVLTGRPVIYDRHEHYPEMILDRDWLPRLLRPFVSKVFDLFERVATKALSAMIVADENMLPRLPDATLLQNFPLRQVFDTLPELSRQPRRLVLAGSLSQARGIWVLLDMMAILKDHDVELLLVGRFDSPETRREFERRIGERGLSDAICCAGQVPHPQVKSYLLQSGIGLVTFLAIPQYQRTFATKLFEYMACGLPVVASDVAPSRKIVTAAGCGVLVEADDPQAYADAVLYLLENPGEAQRMGRNGRRAFLEKYNWEAEEGKLLRLYQILLAK
jgi:glycosyltransferase involved in cell wall biosynthesis